jgi:hypothetical protein
VGTIGQSASRRSQTVLIDQLTLAARAVRDQQHEADAAVREARHSDRERQKATSDDPATRTLVEATIGAAQNRDPGVTRSADRARRVVKNVALGAIGTCAVALRS